MLPKGGASMYLGWLNLCFTSIDILLDGLYRPLYCTEGNYQVNMEKNSSHKNVKYFTESFYMD